MKPIISEHLASKLMPADQFSLAEAKNNVYKCIEMLREEKLTVPLELRAILSLQKYHGREYCHKRYSHWMKEAADAVRDQELNKCLTKGM